MLRDYYGRAPPSFFDCGNAATGRALMYTSVARLGIDSAARARRKLLASVFRRFTEGFDTADFVRANALLTSHSGSARGTLSKRGPRHISRYDVALLARARRSGP